jgi:hypothetical protein
VYGEATVGTILTKKDICSNVGDGKTLQEFFCYNQTDIGSMMVDCPGGCIAGHCI